MADFKLQLTLNGVDVSLDGHTHSYVASVVAGENIEVDATDPANPIVHALVQAGSLIFFFEDVASGLGLGYKLMSNPIADPTESYAVYNTPVHGGLVQAWITDPDVPGIAFVPYGVWEIHCHAFKTGGTNTVQLYGEFYKRDTGGTETLLGTTNLSSALTTVEATIPVIYANVGDTILDVTDRIVCKIRVSVTGGGSDSTSVTVGYSGPTAARMDLPGQSYSLLHNHDVDYADIVHDHDLDYSDIAHTHAAADHGTLTGLGDDDHTQYHTDGRGDARYVMLTTDQSVAGVKTFTSTLRADSTAVITRQLGATTTGFRTTATLIANTTGSAADEMGPFLDFVLTDLETPAGAALVRMGAVRKGADNTGDFVVVPLTAGVETTRLRVSGATGTVTIATPLAANPTLVLGRVSGQSSIKSSAGGNLLLDSDGATDMYIQNIGTGNLRLVESGGGKVGIGMSPVEKLDVTGAIRASQSITIGTGGTYAAGSIFSDANWGMIFRAKQASPVNAHFMWADSAGAELMRISPLGYLGIGTTVPGLLTGTYTQTSTLVDLVNIGGNQYGQLAIRGSVQASLFLIDTGALADMKWMELQTLGGITKFQSIKDNGSGAQASDIIVMDHATGAVAVKAGASAGAEARVGGVLYVTVAAVGNILTGVDTIASYTIPANTLAVNGDCVRFEAYGLYAANSNTKRVGVWFGATQVSDSGALGSNGFDWKVTGTVVRTGATAQLAYSIHWHEVVLNTQIISGLAVAATLSGTVLIKVTGEATATNDIVCEYFKVWWEPNNT